MSEIKPALTNLRGPAARITDATAETIPAGAGTKVNMTGLDQDRKFHFEIERGLPGVNAVPADEAVAAYVAGSDTETIAALDSKFTPLPRMAVNALTGYVHLDGAGMSPLKTAAQNATILQAAFDLAGASGTVYLSEAFGDVTIPVQAGVVTIDHNQVTLLGSPARTEYTPVLKGEGAGAILTVRDFGFNCQGVNLRGDGETVGKVYTATTDGILFDLAQPNTDAKIRDTEFLFMRQAIEFVGRNIDLIGNLFSNCTRGVKATAYAGDYVRGLVVNGNRFHSMGGNSDVDPGEFSVCIDIIGEAHSNQVINNMADNCHNFFRGPVDRSQFNDNHLTLIAGIGFDILTPYPPLLWQIVGNMYMGYPTSGALTQAQLDALPDSPWHFIHAVGDLRDGLIEANIARYTRSHGIRLAMATNVSIIGNHIIDSGMWHYLSDGDVTDGISIGAGSQNEIGLNRIRNQSPGGSLSNRYGIDLGTSTNNRVLPNFLSGYTIRAVNPSTEASNRIDGEGYVRLAQFPAASVPAGTFFMDGGVLKFKDPTGAVKTVTLT